jgi:tripartite-type tricarboxylate transporter receptor subunit TctC
VGVASISSGYRGRFDVISQCLRGTLHFALNIARSIRSGIDHNLETAINYFISPRRRQFITLATLSTLGITSRVRAQSYPSKPVTLIVPSAAGGAADSISRAVSDELGKRLKQPVIVENVGGGSGAIGVQKLMRAAPDGYTVLIGNTTDLVVTPIVNRSAGYLPRDYTTIAKLGGTHLSLVVRPGLNVKTTDELVSLARSKPDALTIGLTGTTSLQAFAAAAFVRATGIKLVTVAYKGGAPLLIDLMGGQVDLAITALPGVQSYVSSGKLVALAVLSPQRAPSAPDIPTVDESTTAKGVHVGIWAALVAPPKLPPEIRRTLYEALDDVLRDKAFIDTRAKMGDQLVPPAGSDELAQLLASEEIRFRALAAGMKFE